MFDQKIAQGPLVLDCVEYRLQPDNPKGYIVKPDLAEKRRRYHLGQLNSLRRLMAPLILRGVRHARADRPKRTT